MKIKPLINNDEIISIKKGLKQHIKILTNLLNVLPEINNVILDSYNNTKTKKNKVQVMINSLEGDFLKQFNELNFNIINSVDTMNRYMQKIAQLGDVLESKSEISITKPIKTSDK